MPVREIDMKICFKCEIEKDRSDFSKNRSKKDGLQSRCKVCDAEGQRSPAGKVVCSRANKKRRSTIRGHLQDVFSSIKSHCTNPKVHNYNRYGGRGIKVCFVSSNEFIDYVINVLQVDPRRLQIDRINNDGNYEQGNIRFVTRSENCRNR